MALAWFLPLGWQSAHGGAPRLLATSDESLIGGAYKIVGKIGAGAMGTVYQALDVKLQRPVALKMMRREIQDDTKERERFIKEARTVAALRHPNIVEIYAIVGQESDLCIVFERVRGRTLAQVLATHGRLSLQQTMDLLQGACNALEYAHARNVVHRDLKPSNIMITTDGTVKLMDFGVARRIRQDGHPARNTKTGPCGTPPYMAPEAEEGFVSPQTDVYALAVCAYECLAGERPFPGVGLALLHEKLNLRFQRLEGRIEGVPTGVDEALARALDPDTARRTKSPRELYEALAGLAVAIA